MKNISIAFCAPAFTIQMNYHYQVQSLLYSLIQREGDFGAELHNSGVAYGSRQYKLFTFSSLRGNKKIMNSHIQFERLVYLDVRSVHVEFCNSLLAALNENTDLTLCGQPLSVQLVKTESKQITSDTLHIKMLSPLTIHSTESGKTYYYNPLDSDFSEQVNRNFQRKYTAFTGQQPTDHIKISPLNIGAKDKYVTTYKDMHITAWRGEFQLSGSPDYLNFLYYCGLGARNSDGFGMFQLL